MERKPINFEFERREQFDGFVWWFDTRVKVDLEYVLDKLVTDGLINEEEAKVITPKEIIYSLNRASDLYAVFIPGRYCLVNGGRVGCRMWLIDGNNLTYDLHFVTLSE